ncbi:CaiB/BaiF CoA transferase family protein [Streptomyces sp. NRRL F-5126]|uniref:CaiB/BaiF CoA transferase family protein n=1 Tax=Streptomyces sp. NRRL F-5126 TaxID=1463857 RepID=UPI0004C68EFC|nr:CaiB/BaiF CoA-transferase family protein [Streptomyces sp. NRRL F-5126]
MTLALGRGTGPLRGLRVVEIAGIGPGPHACMLLADLGADVIRIERPGGPVLSLEDPRHDIALRGRPRVTLDLKAPDAVDTVLSLVERADVLVEGGRPGVAERLGIGPDECMARNPRLVYGRITGWGQSGPLAARAGHDLNYTAVAGTLHGLGQDRSKPHFPSNLLGDFGGGSTYLVIGVLAALVERGASGRGQVVDAAIVDGVAHLNAMTSSFLAAGMHTERRGENILDGGLPNYDVYETADGEHMAVGALEPKFFEEFTRLLGIESPKAAPGGAAAPGKLRAEIAARFRERTRDEWSEVFAGSDACVTPVMRLSEAPAHPHVAERGVFVQRDGVTQPAPAPRFSRTTASLSTPPSEPGENTVEALTAWGIDDAESLVASGAAVPAAR